jgi:hypothetical protein
MHKWVIPWMGELYGEMFEDNDEAGYYSGREGDWIA